MSAPEVDVSGRVAVITGASRGLGAGLAEHLSAAGMRLGLCARTRPALAGGPDVVAAHLDVTDAEAIEAFADDIAARLGPIDLWVNNAGMIEPIGPLRDTEPHAWARNLEVNVVGVANGARAYARHVRGRDGGGVLVNVSSGAATKGYAGWSAYSAGKAAVERLTEVVSLEEADAGLLAYALSPGVIDTDMQAMIRATSPEQFPAVDRFHALKRDDAFNTPRHVARHLLALAFDSASRPDGVSVRVPPEA